MGIKKKTKITGTEKTRVCVGGGPFRSRRKAAGSAFHFVAAYLLFFGRPSVSFIFIFFIFYLFLFLLYIFTFGEVGRCRHLLTWARCRDKRNSRAVKFI